MNFAVSADAYTRFMGRYSEPLAARFAELAGLDAGARVLDVGCGAGALTAELARRLGPGAVCAVEPSEQLATAARHRCPGVDVQRAAAELLPFARGVFDAALAQLVVHFMADPVAGLREMARVTRAGGLVAACVWDYGGRRGPLTTLWDAVHDLDPAARDESDLAGVRQGQLQDLFERAGLTDQRSATLTVRVRHASFEEWWEPYTLGVGPAGAHVAGLGAGPRQALRERCAQLLPAAPFEISATAWAVACRVRVSAT